MPQNRFWNLLAKKLAGEASIAELQELEELMRNNPDWHYPAQHIDDIWNMSMKDDPYEAEEAFLHHVEKMKKKAGDFTMDEAPDQSSRTSHEKKIRLWSYSAAAVVLVIAGVLVFKHFIGSAPKANEEKISEVSTKKGSKSKLVLPDGTLVWLNAGSKLSYKKDFGNAHREITLVGEAFFDVVKMPGLPFVIETNTIEVRVLGTSFNVKSYPDEKITETSLIKGSVEITIKSRPSEKFILKPNEKLVVANKSDKKDGANDDVEMNKIPLVTLDRLTVNPDDSNTIETSWVQNKLIFRNESFKNLAAKMERWYGVEFIFKDRKIEEIHLSGTFEKETIQQALAALQITAHFNYSINQNTVTITQ